MMNTISKEEREHLELTASSGGHGSHFCAGLAKLLAGNGGLSKDEGEAVEAALEQRGALYEKRNAALRSLLGLPAPEPEAPKVDKHAEEIAAREARIAELEAKLLEARTSAPEPEAPKE
jgi:hypothetical protein